MSQDPITLVLGASPNPRRFAFLAIHKLVAAGHTVYAVGNRRGEVAGQPIHRELPKNRPIDTVTLYLNPQRQAAYHEALLNLQPRRIIFNPGTENPALAKAAAEKGIETINACTLVMIASQTY